MNLVERMTARLNEDEVVLLKKLADFISAKKLSDEETNHVVELAKEFYDHGLKVNATESRAVNYDHRHLLFRLTAMKMFPHY